MLRNASHLHGYKIHATDGVLGKVDEFYFDDNAWVIRYMVVQTGEEFFARKVLISPAAMVRVDFENREIDLNITMSQVRDSPDIDTHKTVHRQHEEELARYYQWPFYWTGIGNMGGTFGMPVFNTLIDQEPFEPEPGENASPPDPHLRGTGDVTGYHIRALDGEIGHVADFIIDDAEWNIRYILVDTRNWWPGKKVLVSPRWITGVEWEDRTVTVHLTRDAVQTSPEYDPLRPIDASYSDSLHDHYGHPRESRECEAKPDDPDKCAKG